MKYNNHSLSKILNILILSGLIIAFIPAFTKIFSYSFVAIQSVFLDKPPCFSLQEFTDILVSGVIFFTLVLCASPILILFLISLKKKKKPEEEIKKLYAMIGGAVVYVIIVSFFHFEFWFLATGKPGYSTAPLVYVFFPIICSIVMAIGCAIGEKLGEKKVDKKTRSEKATTLNN